MNLQALTPSDTYDAEHWLSSGVASAITDGNFFGTQNRDYAYLQTCVKVTDLSQMRELAAQRYRQLLILSDKLEKPRFVRIWNYIPQINDGAGDDECYRQFCWGRADALSDRALPAATGIGSRDGWLRIGALCTTAQTTKNSLNVTHLENPRQISAYRYPREYGPRSPSFARATLLESANPPASTSVGDNNRGLLLLSGTASIVSHQTRHVGDLLRQSQETANNINALLDTLQRPSKPLAIRYYLRDASRLAEAMEGYKADFPGWPEANFFAADICRAGLDLEIEGVFSV